MKKRLISFIMMLVMLVSLFSVFAATASADAQVTTVTVAKGDTVLSICQAKGIDFYTYKNLIMKLNGFTSDSAFNHISVGTQLSLPVSNQAAAALAKGGISSAAVGTTVAGTTSGGLTTGTVSSLPSGDHVAYYLATYTIQKGETIGGIYARWGLSYKTYENQIVKLNNLRSINAIQAGKTLLLPTTNPSLPGSTYTTVMAHAMRAGESAYNIVCADYGLNYNSAQAMLQTLNNRTNLGSFRVGELLYIPVSGVVSVSNNVTGGTTSGSTTTGTVSSSGYYNLVSETPKNGSFDLQVSGKSVKTAAAGQVVSIVPVPDTGYAVDTIKVSKVGDTATTTTVNNNSFVMPAYSAIVSVTFKQAKQSEITIDASSNGGIVAMVDNTPVSKAYAGTQVTVKTTPAAGFMLDYIRVTYNDYRDSVAVENGKFTMPNFPVTVTAKFKIDPDYNPTKGSRIFTDVTNATITAKIGDTVTEYAKPGERVTLTVTPNANYVLESIKVYTNDFSKTIALDKMSFDMPDGPVTVVAVVKPTSSAKFAINVAENPDGKVKITVDGKEVTSASPGQTVKVEGSSSKAYYYYLTTVTKVGDSSTIINLGEGNTFTMPDYAVNVNVKFYVYHRVVLDSANGALGSFNVTADGGAVITSCGAGVKLHVNTWGIKNGYSAGTITLYYADGSSYALVNTNEFVMPDCDVRVRVDFKQSVKLVGHPAYGNNPLYGDDKCPSWGNSYTVLGRTLSDKAGTEGQTVEMWAAGGSTVVVKPAANIGYVLDKIYYTYDGVQHDAYWNAQTGNWQFELPKLGEGLSNNRVDLFVKFREIASYKITSNPLDKDNTWGTVDYMTSLGYTDSVAASSKVWIRAFPKSEYTLDWNKVRILDTATGEDITVKCSFDPIDNSFVMPAQDVTVDFTGAVTNLMHSIWYQRISSEGTNTAKGIIKCTIDNVTYTDFTGMNGMGQLLNPSKSPLYVKAGTSVIIAHESLPGYYLQEIKVETNTTHEAVKVTQLTETTCCFTMPLEDVTITPVYTDDYFSVIAKPSANGTYTVPDNAKLVPGAEITDIKPAAGYELDGVYMSYTDANGLLVEKEIEPDSDGRYFAKPNGLPQSAVTVEVRFAPISQALNIIYEFGADEGSVSASNSYKVDVFVDGVQQEITRNTGKDSKAYQQDTITNGIGTGKTVVLREVASGKDERFEIKNIWVLYNDNKDAAALYTNGDYYFTMPSVESGACEIHVRYALKNSDKYALDASVAGGATIAGLNELTPNSTSATASVGIGRLNTIKVQTDTTPVNHDAYVTYTDNNGVEQKITVKGVVNSGGLVEFTFGDSEHLPAITSAPKSDVTFSYDPSGKQVTVTAREGAPAITVSGNQTQNSTITVAAADGRTIKSVALYKAGTDEAYGIHAKIAEDGKSASFQLTADSVEVQLELVSQAAITLTTEGDGTAAMSVGERELTGTGDSADVGACITVTAKANDDTYDVGSSIKVEIDGKELDEAKITDYKNGTYQFRVPADAKEIDVTVTFAPNKHEVEVEGDTSVILKVGGKKVETVASGDTLLVCPPDGKRITSLTHSYTAYVDGEDVTVEGKTAEKQRAWEKNKDGTDNTNGYIEIKLDKPIKVGEKVTINVTLADAPKTAAAPAASAPVVVTDALPSPSAASVPAPDADADSGYLTLG